MKPLWLLPLLAAGAAAQVVEGTVVNSTTGTGIPNIGINLQQVTSGAYRVYQARTDGQGRFRFANVQDGMYDALLASNDYWSSEEPRRFSVAAGGPAVQLEAHMTPLPHIWGRVVDGRGEPVAHATVDLASAPGGLAFSLETDAAGRFDVRERPGAYTLSAVAPPGLKPPEAGKDSGQALGWTRTFYPGVSVAEAATRIVVRPGVDVSDLQVKLLAAPVHAVRGVLVKPDGTPAGKAAMVLIDTAGLAARLPTESKPDGTFEFVAVPEGERFFWVELDNGGMKLRASQWIAVAGRDMEDVKVRLMAPFAVAGRVVWEGAQGGPPARPPSVVLVSVNRHGVGPQMVMTARPDAEGHFTLKQVYEGEYRLDDFTAPPPYYLDAVRLGEVEQPALQFELVTGSPELTVVYKANGGTVRGAVEKCSGGTVWLIPTERALEPAFRRNTRCSGNDRYEMTAVRPGEYYALALAGGGSGPAAPPELDESALNQAARVTVRAGETISADLRAAAIN